jgi:signal transduction histidine kinase
MPGLAAGAAVLLAIGATLTSRIRGESTTYPGHSIILAVALFLAGVSLLAAGLAIRRLQPPLFTLAAAAAVTWLTVPLEGWQGGPAAARAVGMIAANFVFVVVAHLVLVATLGPLTGRIRRSVVALYAVTTVASITLVLVGDPILDPNCWANCSSSPFVVSQQPDLARSVDSIQTWVTTAAATALLLAGLTWLLDRPRLRAWEVLPGGLVFAGSTVAYGFLLWRQAPENPDTPSFWAIFLIESIALVLIAVGLCAVLFHTARRRRRVGRLIVDLSDSPPAGSLDQTLARILGDPGLRIFYWLPNAGYFANAHGEPSSEPPANGRVVTTPLVRNGHTVAVITHHTDPVELERSLGPAMKLALENERLQAEIRARIRELTESRNRIVEAGDARRRLLERDLHDGVQQSLLAMSADLARARVAAEGWGDSNALALIDEAVAGTREAFRELRELAHGIYPAVLPAAGLCAALGSLVDNDRLAVEVDCQVDERLTAMVENACYVLASTTVEAAAAHSSKRVSILVSRRPESVVLSVEYDGPDLTGDLQHLSDRIGAAGGSLGLTAGAVEAEVPCGS